MERLTQEQWQWLWAQRPRRKEEATDWLFEMITEAGFDVQNDVVTKP